MTELLEQAISKIKTLPSDQQEAIASIILEEIQVNQQWNQFSLEQAMRDLGNSGHWCSLIKGEKSYGVRLRGNGEIIKT